MDAEGNSAEYPISRLAQSLPAMPDHEYEALKADTCENGQRDPIAILDNEVVDGRHRQRALTELGIEPQYEFLPADTDPLKYILSKNRHRRNMNTSQAALAAAWIYLLSREASQQVSGNDDREGPGSANLQIPPLTQDQAVALFGVRQRTFSDAVSVLKSDAAEALEKGVDQGHIAVSDAKNIVAQPHNLQDAAVAMVVEGKTRTARTAVNRILREDSGKIEFEESTGESWRSSNGRAELHNCSGSRLISLVKKGSVDTVFALGPLGPHAPTTLKELREFLAHALREDGLALLLCRISGLSDLFRYVPGKDIEFLCELDYRMDVPIRPLGRKAQDHLESYAPAGLREVRECPQRRGRCHSGSSGGGGNYGSAKR